MLVAVALVPSAPVLVPELAGAAATETVEVRAAIADAVAALPGRWVAVGVDARAGYVAPSAVGTFAGYGVDRVVRLSPQADRPAVLPLAALITGWIRGTAAPRAAAEVLLYPAELSADDAAAEGRALRSALDDADEEVGLLVVADGLRTLTPPAPGGFDPDSVAVQQRVDDALAAGDGAALRDLPDAVTGRVAYQVLAGAVEHPAAAVERYRGAPFGVGYFVGAWRPAGRSEATGGSTE
ncbi:hypothetical protein LV457_16420 [Mycobacterium sp. MYCO198283]|uniref:hypothetical protein n=1 Tax=Mycobacterium sp. MYCO198283 TaxID=2883505 RepID=UPI001E3F4E0C|nr:hypothetical protein [Mycobacterium sp. MYCO198283]MCG5433861.1 hypothetical protein [Mycobacterium sp. MYCO198283]